MSSASERPPEPLPGCRAEASALYARGENDAALACIDEALARFVLPLETMRLREHVLCALPYLGTLLPHFELVVRDHPSSADASARLVSASMKAGLDDVARGEIDRFLAIAPTVALRLDRADVDVRSGRREDALASVDAALAMQPTLDETLRITRLLLRLGALSRARALALATVKRAPIAASARLSLAWICLYQGDARRAAMLVADLLPRPGGADHLEAAIALVEKRWDDAVDLARRATKRAPDDLDALALLAAAQYRVGAFEEANRNANRAAYSDDGWMHAAQLVRTAASLSLVRDLRPDPEIESLIRTYTPVVLPVLHVDPSAPSDADATLAFLEAAMERLSGNFTRQPTHLASEAPTWRPLQGIDPPRVLCVRTFDHINARPVASVRDALRALIDRMPHSPYPHVQLAELSLWLGEYDDCDDACRAALAITEGPASEWARIGLGASLVMRGREPEALEVFAESERRFPVGASICAYRGEALRRMGRLDEAEAELARALEMAPRCVSAWMQLALIANARKRFSKVRAIHTAIERAVPLLLLDVMRELRGTRETRPPIVEEVVAIFEHALAAMRGNRSPQRITYLLRDGKLRIAHPSALDFPE